MRQFVSEFHYGKLIFLKTFFQTRLKSCCDTIRYGEAKGKNKTRTTSSEHRNIRETVPGKRFQRPSVERVHKQCCQISRCKVNFHRNNFSTTTCRNVSLPFLRPAFAPIYANQYSHSSSSVAQSSPIPWAGNHHPFLAQQYHSVAAGVNIKREVDVASSCSGRKEKRQYKKRKHKTAQRDKPYPSPGNGKF